MAFKLPDRVYETTTTTGNGSTITLDGVAGAAGEWQGFVDAVGDTNTTIALVKGSGAWEMLYVTVNNASPDTLTVTTFLRSSTGSKISWAAGTKEVRVAAEGDILELLMDPTLGTGLIVRDNSGIDTMSHVMRQIAGTYGVTVTNGNGVSGDPTVEIQRATYQGGNFTAAIGTLYRPRSIGGIDITLPTSGLSTGDCFWLIDYYFTFDSSNPVKLKYASTSIMGNAGDYVLMQPGRIWQVMYTTSFGWRVN